MVSEPDGRVARHPGLEASSCGQFDPEHTVVAVELGVGDPPIAGSIQKQLHRNRTRVQELPHFKAAMTEETGRLEGGVWAYYTWKVSQDL